MLIAFLAATTAQPVVLQRPVSAETPARASVRILRAAVIRADNLEATEESVKRTTSVRERDGTFRLARLIEFY
ncbi:MAG TPA: hypothetical protein VJ775_00370 [Sphingomicrobium sp.]|nr:hypothetical protein [Sphingomicrobium sp.]